MHIPPQATQQSERVSFGGTCTFQHLAIHVFFSNMFYVCFSYTLTILFFDILYVCFAYVN